MSHDAAPSPQNSDPHLAELLSRIDGIIANEANDALAASGRSTANHTQVAGEQNAAPGVPPAFQDNPPANQGNPEGIPLSASESNTASGATPSLTQAAPVPAGDAVGTNPNQLAGGTCDVTQEGPSFGKLTGTRDEPFVPLEPQDLAAAGLPESMVEELIVRYLAARGEASGRNIADQVKLPFRLVEPILNRLKYEQLTAYRGSNSVGDYTHTLTDSGRERARQFNLRTTYFGSAPVTLEVYNESVGLQSVEGQYPRQQELLHAFKDLLIDRKMLGKLGPAINSGKGMFLYGFPGNGKTSIAERVTQAFGKYIWIPRSLVVDGEIMRLYDPLMHELAEEEANEGWLNDSGIDQRWVRIKRPTIIAGGELTMEMLEVQKNNVSNVSESPLQMKSNCGVLVIDDFGRQKMRVDELLNRWIVPLEKRYDFLNMASGKKTQVPFNQLVIFSTNLQPKDLVDDAFLRRIPYKIEVENPTEGAFRKLFEIMCPIWKIPHDEQAITYLIEQHYKPTDRPFRNCHPRDILLQIKNYCLYHDQPLELKREYIDFAVDNYFSIM
ncbi:MAG: AAA family ATPase [Planctomycetota bacterium]